MTSHATDREVELIADGMMFPEGPRWHDGRLWVSDFFDRHVLTFAPDGTREHVCDVPNGPSGLGFTPAGELLVVSMQDKRLLKLQDGALVEHADLSALAAGPCNDMYVDPSGRAYVGNFGSDLDDEPIRPTALVRVEPDGSASVAADGIVFPNGTVVTADGATMLVAESFAFRISAFDLAPDGSLSNRRLWADFGPGPAADVPAVLATDAIVPDGMCIDAEDGVWVADAKGAGALRMVDGRVVDAVDTGDVTAFAVTLGGEDGRTLFMAAGPSLGTIDPSRERAGSILSARVDVPGAAWAS